MKNQSLKKLALLGVLVASSAQATEIRSPWISEHGPLRYTFERLHEDKWNVNYWSAAHLKEAHKAFMKHGTKTSPYTQLIFNKSEFKLQEIFPNSQVPLNSQFYSPQLALTTVTPRAEYTEYGMTLGARVDFPVWCNKGRVGLRATVPFRRIEIERTDTTFDVDNDPLAQFKISKVVRVDRKNPAGDMASGTEFGLPANANDEVDIIVNAYRADFVAALRNGQYQSAIQLSGVGEVKVFGNNIAVGANQKNLSTVGITQAASADALFTNGFVAWITANDLEATNPAVSHVNVAEITMISADLETAVPTVNQIGVFDNTLDYRTDHIVGSGFDPNALNQATTVELENYWMTFRRDTDSNDLERFSRDPLGNPGVGGVIARKIEQQAPIYSQNPFSLFSDNGFNPETSIRSGLGDIDVDVFYEHDFNEDWRGEAWVGVRLPTGNGKDYSNPYQANLGNGEHWELKLGGLMAWQPLCWMVIKVDAMYSFVLEATETRAAAFKGATIKNFGPATKADVDWGYAVGHVDFTFFHPQTEKVRSMIGYEIYYKTQDHLSFKVKEMQSWLGQAYNDAGVLVANNQPLDNDLARMNTESLAHKVRGETSCQINKYFEVFAGGSAVFAGQNVTRDWDLHAGYNIRF